MLGLHNFMINIYSPEAKGSPAEFFDRNSQIPFQQFQLFQHCQRGSILAILLSELVNVRASSKTVCG